MTDYVELGFENEAPAGPIRFIITDDTDGVIAESATIELVTSVTPGTALDATSMNHLDAGIALVDSKVNAVQAQADTGIPKVYTAKGQIAVATGNNALTALAVGSNGKSLVADSTQASGVKWANDVYGVVAVKGDLIAGTAVDTAARVPIGATGTYLIPDSSTATGLDWAAMFTPEKVSSTSWDSDAKSANTSYNITMGTTFAGIPTTAKMVQVWLAAKWASIDGSSEIWIAPYGVTIGVKHRLLTVRGQVADHFNDAVGWVMLDGSGRFTVQTGANAPSQVYMEISGYML